MILKTSRSNSLGPRIPIKTKVIHATGGLLKLVAMAALVTLTAQALPAGAQLAEGNPRLALPPSRLNAPFTTPVFLVGHASWGGGFKDEEGDLGYGGALIFRPGHSVNIFSSFLNWNAGMVIQVDYLQVPDGGDIISGDLIMRRYFNNRGDQKTNVNLFLGLGTGLSDIRRPDPGDVAAGDHWSILVEAGQEWFFSNSTLFFVKGQYRWMINAGRTWRTWTVMAGLGVAWPWP